MARACMQRIQARTISDSMAFPFIANTRANNDSRSVFCRSTNLKIPKSASTEAKAEGMFGKVSSSDDSSGRSILGLFLFALLGEEALLDRLEDFAGDLPFEIVGLLPASLTAMLDFEGLLVLLACLLDLVLTGAMSAINVLQIHRHNNNQSKTIALLSNSTNQK